MTFFLSVQVLHYLFVLPSIGFFSLNYLIHSLKLKRLAIYHFYSVYAVFGIFLYLALLQLNLYICALLFNLSSFIVVLGVTNVISVLFSGVLGFKYFYHKKNLVRVAFENWKKNQRFGVILFASILFLFVGFFPLYENDTLEYFGVARQIQEFGLTNYPPINTTAAESIYAPSTHPPYFHLFISTTWIPGTTLLLFKFVYVLFLIAFLRLLSGNS